MKILFAANRFPFPPFRGDKLKIYNLAKRLQANHEIHLITFLQDKEDLQYLPELEAIFTKIHLIDHSKMDSYFQTARAIFSNKPLQVGYFRSRKMKDAIDDLLEKETFDAVHVQHLRLAQYWKNKALPRILDLPDAYSLYWKRRVDSSKGFAKIFNRIEQKRVFEYEDVLNRFDLSLVCSREDMEYLQEDKNIKNVHLLANGVDSKQFSFPENDYSEDKNILFTGNMDYAPNVDAVIYFVEEILPLILKELPDVHFTIAGQRPVEKVMRLQSDKVTITGFIPILADVYKTAAIVVAPLRFGAGTQNKVLEAMSTGIPVVSRNIGFKGLGIASGEGVFLEMETQGFADRCIALLKDKTLRTETGKKGERVIKENYDWDAIALQLEKYLLSISKK